MIEIKQTNKNKSKSNLSNAGQEAVKYLAKRREIIITTADKSGAVVINDTEKYIKETYHQLSNKISYQFLQTDVTLQCNRMVNDILDGFKNENLLSEKTENHKTEGLKIINLKTPKFYITPKIHKEKKNKTLGIKRICSNLKKIKRIQMT